MIKKHFIEILYFDKWDKNEISYFKNKKAIKSLHAQYSLIICSENNAKIKNFFSGIILFNSFSILAMFSKKNNKIRILSMGNLCSIFHERFKHLTKIIPCANQARLMDYILLGWQTSTYRLSNSTNKWFMKPHEGIAEELNLKLSTLRRYLKEFEQRGFIERRQARYNRITEKGTYNVTMGGYINITDKFLSLLNTNKNSVNKPPSKPVVNEKLSSIKQIGELSISSFINNNESPENLNSRVSYIRDLDCSFKNNIIFKNLTSSVDNSILKVLIKQFESIQQLFIKEIKEEIPEEVKKLVLGTFFNLTFKHQKRFSSPAQVGAEYIFALLNSQYYLPDIECFKHRNNILAKMMRNNLWATPKGFYKHFYLGQNFKDKNELRDKYLMAEKQNELDALHTAALKTKDSRLSMIEVQMEVKSGLINQLTQSIQQESREDMILILREQILEVRQELEMLWGEQYQIEIELERAEELLYVNCA